jgi:hypothetical protein
MEDEDIFCSLFSGCGCNCGCTLLNTANVSSIWRYSSVRARLCKYLIECDLLKDGR